MTEKQYFFGAITCLYCFNSQDDILAFGLSVKCTPQAHLFEHVGPAVGVCLGRLWKIPEGQLGLKKWANEREPKVLEPNHISHSLAVS